MCTTSLRSFQLLQPIVVVNGHALQLSVGLRIVSECIARATAANSLGRVAFIDSSVLRCASARADSDVDTYVRRPSVR